MFRNRNNISTRTQSNSAKSHRPLHKLWLTSLEDRTVPAALVVTDAGDTGLTTQLRGIINAANINGAADTITFAAGINVVNLLNGRSATRKPRI